jgi:TPR repeat protein
MLILLSGQGEQKICYNIGYLYENGVEYRSDEGLFHSIFSHAKHWYSTAAINGDSRTSHRLGIMYEEGKDVNIDLAMAFNYYSKANEAEISDAAYRLAPMYMNDEAIAQDLVKAYALFTKACNKEHKKV